MSPLRSPVIGYFVQSYLMAASKQHRCGNTPNHLADPCDLPSYSHSGIWLPSRAVSSQEPRGSAGPSVPWYLAASGNTTSILCATVRVAPGVGVQNVAVSGASAAWP